MNPPVSSLLFITGWAHGPEAVQPMADVLSEKFDVQILTGAQVLNDRKVPDVDFIVTGSMGGLLSVELLPATCRKLVLISSTAKFCSDEGYPCGTTERVLRRMILQLKHNPQTVLDAFFKNAHFPHRESRQAIAMRKKAALHSDDLVSGLEYLLNSDVRERVSSISIPVLLLHGAEDRIIPPAASEWLHAHLPASSLKIVENDGHALPAHHFETIMKAIAGFLPA